MAGELDLERGDIEAAQKIADLGGARSRSKRASSGGSSGGGGKSSGSKSGTKRTDSELVTRLVTSFEKIADQLEAREDHELSQAIREDARAMSQGLVSLTSTLTPLRVPLILFLGFIEPILAFWHVGSILVGRFIARRQRVMAEREMEAAAAATVPPMEYAG